MTIEFYTLAAQIEADMPQGPRRENDWKVAELLGIPETWKPTASWPPFSPGSRFEKSIPHFTSSVDAALTLARNDLEASLALQMAADFYASSPAQWRQALPGYITAYLLRRRCN